MNIYLDIDGVLRGSASPRADVEDFLRYVLDNYPGHVYWLTSFARHDNSMVRRVLEGAINDELVERACNEVKVAEWDYKKTDGIDFEQPFVWFDDNLSQADEMALYMNNVIDNIVVMNPRDAGAAKVAKERLEKLKSC